ncbi:MAG: hypothetical protein IKZ97_08600 [Butyrivibrio sp.]|nr:hypothetical protein [Butyrivibrio sp.]
MKKGIKRAGRRLRNLVVAAMVLSMVFATDVNASASMNEFENMSIEEQFTDVEKQCDEITEQLNDIKELVEPWSEDINNNWDSYSRDEKKEILKKIDEMVKKLEEMLKSVESIL